MRDIDRPDQASHSSTNPQNLARAGDRLHSILTKPVYSKESCRRFDELVHQISEGIMRGIATYNKREEENELPPATPTEIVRALAQSALDCAWVQLIELDKYEDKPEETLEIFVELLRDDMLRRPDCNW